MEYDVKRDVRRYCEKNGLRLLETPPRTRDTQRSHYGNIVTLRRLPQCPSEGQLDLYNTDIGQKLYRVRKKKNNEKGYRRTPAESRLPFIPVRPGSTWTPATNLNKD